MPEGDTVWLAAKRMNTALAGRQLTAAELRVPAYATVDLVGRRVVEVIPRGKHMLTRLDDGRTLHTHLRLDGAWQLVRAGARWRGGAAHQVRVVLANADWQAVGFRIHDIAVVPTADEHRLVGHLGPDLLGPDWDAPEATRRIAGQPDRAIAEALLDQRNLAGIGNLYKSETLFLRGISPWAPVSTVDDLTGVVMLAQRLIAANREHPEQATTGDLHRGRQHWVYRRGREPCRRCGTPIRGAMQAERITFWCPACQPAPAQAAAARS
ncbi:MAG TPA: DNA-formamidopyrimidine glycosylase family protein [Mycobacteriales bacterium]